MQEETPPPKPPEDESFLRGLFRSMVEDLALGVRVVAVTTILGALGGAVFALVKGMGLGAAGLIVAALGGLAGLIFGLALVFSPLFGEG